MRSEKRLHPLSFIFMLGSTLRSLVIPLLLVLFASRSLQTMAWWLPAIFLITLSGIFRYLTYRYEFAPDDLVIRSGLIFRNERHIPYARIHNIDAIQNLLHRLFGVVEVKIETAGGGDVTEARIRVLSVPALEEMREHIRRRKTFSSGEDQSAPVPEATDPPSRTLLRLPVSELLVLGVVNNRGMVLVGAAMGLAWEFGIFGGGEGIGEDVRQFVTRAGEAARPFLKTGIVMITTVFIVLVLLRLFSMGMALVRHYGFTLQRSGRDLVTVGGLFTRVTTTIPIHRIQVVTIREKLLYRLLGRAEIRVDLAGSRGEEGSTGTTKYLTPIIVRNRIADLMHEVQPGIPIDDVEWTSIDPRGYRRMLRVSLVFLAMISLVAVFLFGPWGLAPPLLLVPLVALNARKQVQHTGYALVSDVLLFRSGWLWRRLSLARFSKIQVVRMGETLFDRRHDMARLYVDTAGSGWPGQGILVPYLDRAIARGLFDQLGAAAARTTFKW